MKKAIPLLVWLLFVLTILFPVGTVVSACFGYTLELTSIPAFVALLAVLSACVVVLSLVVKGAVESKVVCILSAALAPLSLLNAVFCIAACSRIGVIAGVLVSAGSCCCLAATYARPFALKSTVLILSALMVLPIGYFSCMALIFGNIGQNTVVQTVASPSGNYYAQVVDSDQGAMGGNTLVDVYENEMSIVVFRIYKQPQRVYCGDWGEFENMDIYWADDTCLVINSVEYEIE